MELNSKTINFLLENERLKSFVNDEKITNEFLDFFAKNYCENLQENIGDFKEAFLIENAISAGIYFGFYFDNFSFWISEKKDALVSFIEEHWQSFVRATKDFLLSIVRASDVEDIFAIKDEILKELVFFCKSNDIAYKLADNSFVTVLFYAFLLGASQGRTVTVPVPKKIKIN
ncbi:MAG: hypothetical protein IKW45_04830 [Clostridia bacterium]|nr:hypothetical protein [Clostridia bacterium]